MLLMLKEDFTFKIKGKVRSYVDEEGILKIDSRQVDWDKTMYALAYKLKKMERCPYCGTELRKTNMTIDHMFPRNYGGVSVSNNLIPCCNDCNSTKSNLDVEEFTEWMKKETQEEKDRFRNETIKKKESIRYLKGFILPTKWISYVDINKLQVREFYKSATITSKRMKDNLEYIEKYNHLQRPIIVDRNFWILDGYICYLAAKQSGKFTEVPIVLLENVELTGM